MPAVYLLNEELAPFTTSDEVFYIYDGYGPIKTILESLADQCSRGRVIAAGTKVNFEK
jgi:hypothetical protein